MRISRWLLERYLKHRKKSRPEKIPIEIRASSGFAAPEIDEYCEEEGLTYTLGLARNLRLEAVCVWADEVYVKAGLEKDKAVGGPGGLERWQQEDSFGDERLSEIDRQLV